MAGDSTLHPWLTLVHAKGLGPGLLRRLLEGLGTIDAILGASDSKLKQCGLPEKVVASMRRVDEAAIQTDLDWMNDAEDRTIITRDSDRYPIRLKEIADPPLVLYVRGDADVLSTPQLAIVGSRKPSHSAESHAFEFAHKLANYGITITSGMALGVDGCAHRGALAADGYTIAVTATGLDRVYPAKHQQLAQEIASRSAIISEFPIGTNPHASFFPRRNRIISGLCYGTLVVEATLKSGTLTTAAHATSQAREVFAIPGNIDNPQSRGCHALLKNGATLVEEVADILEVIAPLLPQEIHFAPSDEPVPESSKPPPDRLTQNQSNQKHLTQNELTQNQSAQNQPTRNQPVPDHPTRSLLDVLGHDSMSLDELVTRSGLGVVTVTQMTLDLELEGQIKKIPGGNFVRISSGTT